MARKLTNDQKRALRRMVDADGYLGTDCAPIGHRVGRQLEKRGLAYYTRHDHERVEWDKVLAKIPIYQLTPEGRGVALALKEELKARGETD